MKNKLCEAFCNTVQIREIPIGLAISSTFAFSNDDPLLFFICGPDKEDNFIIKDSGTLLPYLDAIGADIENDTRRETFENLLDSCGAKYDLEQMEIFIGPIKRDAIAERSIQFLALLIRIADLEFMAQERAASTFKDDVISLLREAIGDKASIRQGEPISSKTPDWFPDLIVQAKGRDPVAVFLVQNEQRILEALLLQSDIVKLNADGQVVALLEMDSSIRKNTRIKATNRLDGLAIYETDKDGAISKVAEKALGRRAA